MKTEYDNLADSSGKPHLSNSRLVIVTGVLLFLSSLFSYLHLANELPTLFNIDNNLNYSATDYLLEHRALPVVEANDPEIEFTDIGTTRLTRPPLTFILSAIVSDVTSGVVDSRVIRHRLASPILAAITIVLVFIGFNIAFRQVWLSFLGAMLLAVLPKFVFLASCNNDDIGAIFSVSALFTCTLALNRYGVTKPVLLGLAVSTGLILQTKFTAWLCLPWLLCFILWRLHRSTLRLLRLVPLLSIVMILCGGWWILFNVFNYGVTDPSGLSHAADIQLERTGIEQNAVGYHTHGVGVLDLMLNYDQFLTKSYTSLIGYLQWLDLDLGVKVYAFYGAVFLVALCGVFLRLFFNRSSSSLFDLMILMMVISQCCFYLHHNWLRDIQPQARYILPMVVPLLYLFLRQLSYVPSSAVLLKLGPYQWQGRSLLVSLLMIVLVVTTAETWQDHVKPSYVAKPFQLRLLRPQKMDFGVELQQATTNGLDYAIQGDSLILTRTDSTLAELNLGEVFCKRLPVNGLMMFDTSSPAGGGLQLRVDEDKKQYVSWQGVAHGEGRIEFSFRSNACSGVILSLSKGTHILTLSNWKLRNLRIHEHGNPI